VVKLLKEIKEEGIAQKVEVKKRLLIEFLKRNNWTSQDMSQNWFEDKDG